MSEEEYAPFLARYEAMDELGRAGVEFRAKNIEITSPGCLGEFMASGGLADAIRREYARCIVEEESGAPIPGELN